MFLFELDQGKALVGDVVALTRQLQQELDRGELENYTVDQLLDYFQEYDIIIDVQDLYNMIKVPPLKDVIDNIQGDRVVFKGQEGEKPPETEKTQNDQEEVVDKMADRANELT